MLSPNDLASLPDFPLAALLVSPSRRQVCRGERTATVEPRVMQVLVLLARADGEVVTRQQLLDEVWGVPVGEDSLNRAIAGVRRALALDGDGIHLETIPRTGYRLTVGAEGPGVGSATAASRRTLILGGTAALALAAGGGWWHSRSKVKQQVEALIDRGERALDYGDTARLDGVPALEKAVALRPDDARAQGLLAIARALRPGQGGSGGELMAQADDAARKALEIDPSQPDARLAQLINRKNTLDFASTEDQLVNILRDHPDHARTMQEYWRMLTCVGRGRAALGWVEKALKIAPFSAAYTYPQAQLLWITGRDAEADRIIDRAHTLWPEHRFVRFARFIILSFTGRPEAALAMIEQPQAAPQGFSAESIALWKISLAALERREPAKVAAAIDANLRGAKEDLPRTSQAVMTLSVLGEVDEAFALLEGLFVTGATGGTEAPSNTSRAWRFAPWLFTPPLAAVRADPRFDELTRSIGLDDYWRKRALRPDYLS